jgi:hypothetical protein
MIGHATACPPGELYIIGSDGGRHTPEFNMHEKGGTAVLSMPAEQLVNIDGMMD